MTSFAEPPCTLRIETEVRIEVEGWLGAFRVWQIREGYALRSPMIPMWPVLGKGREPLPEDRMGSHLDGSKELVEAVAEIPLDVRELVEPLGAFQWIGLEAIHDDPSFAQFLAQEVEGGGCSYVVAVWILSGIERRGREERRRINSQIISRPRVEFLSALLDIPVSPAFVKAIRKLTPQDFQRATILQLLSASLNPVKRGWIKKLDAISPALLSLLSEIPDWLAVASILPALEEMSVIGMSCESVIPPAILNVHEDGKNALVTSLKGVRTLEELEGWAAHWSQKLWLAAPFPEPPIPGDRRLIPIRSGDELKREGKIMHSCVAGYVDTILEEMTFFYRWMGEERGTVQLMRGHRNQWELHEHLGFKNAPLSEKTIQAIHATVDPQLAVIDPLFGRPLLLATSVAGTPHHQPESIRFSLSEGEEVSLLREPDNPHDRNAIAVFSAMGAKLGYIPRHKNRSLARALDGGETPVAIIVHLSSNPWSMIEIEVYGKALEDFPIPVAV